MESTMEKEHKNGLILSFVEIFEIFGTDTKIVIPKIQRDYAQGRKTERKKRTNFLKVLASALKMEESLTLDFIYGNRENNAMIPLDGQQRLTTLFLLHWYAAKKENIALDAYSFLERFTYETRPSARDFFKELIKFSPSFQKAISHDVINQAWFPLNWQKDPTIESVLIMLDAINEHFQDIEHLWDKLTNKKLIKFYFIDIKTMGLSDDIYIKMNSRGKPLTDFELLKAELESGLQKQAGMSSQEIESIIRKFDNEWTNLIWIYAKQDDCQVDGRFFNYIRFLYNIISYENDEPVVAEADLDTLLIYFSNSAHIKMLEKYFDCWNSFSDEANNTPYNFFNSFIAKKYEKNKIVVADNYSIDVLGDCLNNNMFTLGKTVFLYAVIIYLLNKSSVTEADFNRRIRIINNLIRNSDDEIAVRTANNPMPQILKQVRHIMLSGQIDNQLKKNFNTFQLDEETQKISFLQTKPDSAGALFELESHPLLYGQIAIIGVNHLAYLKGFQSLFACNLDKVNCALMTIGNYCQKENDVRYQYASANETTWKKLFHKNKNNKYFENTSSCLHELLKKQEAGGPFDNSFLDKLISDYLSSCEKEKRFPFNYYYIKYQEFRKGSGKFYNDNAKLAPYMFVVMKTEKELSENSYNPYLKIAAPSDLSRESYGRRLLLRNDDYIESQNDKYVHYQSDGTIVKEISIPQNSDGIDIENRIELLKTYLNDNNLISLS